MNNRTILYGFGLLVVGGIVALIIAMGAEGEGAGSDRATGDTVSERAGAEPRAAAARGDRPQLASPGSERPSDSEPAEATVHMGDGGVMVRDHRRDRSEPAPRSPSSKPLTKPRKMTAGALMAVRNQLRKRVRKCEKEANEEGMGPAPHLQAVVTVTVIAEKLTVDDISVEAFDVVVAGAMESCVLTGFMGQVLSVPGQPDIADFKQNHPFRLRR